MDFRLGLIYYPLKGKVRGGLAFPLTRDVKVTGKAVWYPFAQGGIPKRRH